MPVNLLSHPYIYPEQYGDYKLRERTVASPHTRIYGREVGGVANYVLATPT